MVSDHRSSSGEELTAAAEEVKEEHDVNVAAASPLPQQQEEQRYLHVRRRRSRWWAAQIRDPGAQCGVWLGTYDTAAEAARVFDRAQLEMRRKLARVNFPDEVTGTARALPSKHKEPARLSDESSSLNTRSPDGPVVLDDLEERERGLAWLDLNIPCTDLALLPEGSAARVNFPDEVTGTARALPSKQKEPARFSDESSSLNTRSSERSVVLGALEENNTARAQPQSELALLPGGSALLNFPDKINVLKPSFEWSPWLNTDLNLALSLSSSSQGSARLNVPDEKNTALAPSSEGSAGLLNVALAPSSEGGSRADVLQDGMMAATAHHSPGSYHCASLGAMGSLLGKLHALLAPGCRLPTMVRAGMKLLRDDLEEIIAYLEDLSEVEDPPLTAKCWMKEVRELSYDMEDYIDKFVQLPACAKIKSRSLSKIRHVRITGLPKRLKWHHKIANMISEFRMYVREAIERHERYDLDCGTLRRRFVSIGPMLPTPYQETAHLVIDGQMSEFISSLANDRDPQLKVVSVVGSGCLGKTTLARMFYNKFGGQYNCRAFVRVSQKPDMKRIFQDMLSQVQRQHPPDDCKELDLLDNIRKHLQDKRYLVIIDDLWAASAWDIINQAFPEGSQRSRIITTTQIEDVALSCCCYRSEYVFEMKPLDDYHSRKLFFNRLFGSESDCPQQFKEVSNEIVGICGGLPLATISIASLSKPACYINGSADVHT